MVNDFRFKVGDLVILKVSIADCELWAKIGETRVPIVFVVTERVSQECYAGVQHNYLLGYADKKLNANDVEIHGLMADFDFAPIRAIADAAKDDKDERDHQRWIKQAGRRKADKAKLDS